MKGVKAITYIVTCPDKQVVLSTLCSLLNSVSAIVTLSPDNPLIFLDAQVQPSKLAVTIRSCCYRRSEADLCRNLLTVSACPHSLSNPRRKRQLTKELLPAFPGTTSSTSRLPISCGWDDPNSSSASKAKLSTDSRITNINSCKLPHRTCLVVRSH